MNTKKLIAGCMAMLILSGSVLEMQIEAQAEASQQICRRDMAAAPLSGTETDFYQADELQSTKSRLSLKSTQTDSSYSLLDSEWADYGGDYYFSLLNTKEKKLYLNLKTQADAYMTGKDNFQSTKVVRDGQEVKIYILPLVSYQGLTTAQMKKVYYCFLFENPQYYFIRNSVVYSEKTAMMTIGLYDLFANGSRREAYTKAFAQQLDSWEQQIAKAAAAVEKEQLIHQIVCDNVSFNNEAGEDDPDDRVMSQSCISAVLFEHSTVCVGYAQLFSLLCNGSGIKCVTVTSGSHAWNKVRLGGVWYNVDCTWDDNCGSQAYLNVTDKQLRAQDTELAEHTMSQEWKGIAPACADVFDTAAAAGEDIETDVPAPGKIAEVSAQSREKGRISVSFQSAEGCDGYMVQYALNSSMGSAKKKEVEKNSCAITGLKSGRTYYIRVRAYVLESNGNKLYGSYSKKQKLTVK